MFNIENISLSFTFNWIFFFLLIVLSSIWTLFYYRITVPPLSGFYKVGLTILRFLSLTLLLFFIFEPILTITTKKEIVPKHLVFIDNSESIKIDDGMNKSGIINQFINDLKNSNIKDNVALLTFGKEITPGNLDSINLKFSEPASNFAKLISHVKQIEEAASITIISDGIITEGSQAINSAEKLSVPIFTIGVGDSTKRKDIFIQNVIHNEIIYVGSTTQLLTTIVNRGISNQNITIQLFEENKLIEQKNYFLNYEGNHNINFDYKPESPGEKKLTIKVNPLNEEFSKENNSKLFFVKVLSNKIEVTLIGGTATTDFSFIKNSLLNDTNIVVNSIVQLGTNKYLNNTPVTKFVNDADILFLIGFPTAETSLDLLSLIQQKISTKNIPFFILLSPFVDVNKLKQIQGELPFSVNKVSSGQLEAQPLISADEQRNPIIQNNALNLIDTWNNLPPVLIPNWEISSKPESQQIAKIKVNNVTLNTPLILTKRFGTKRSIAVTGSDIWRWKLIRAQSGIDLFDRFLMNSLKWLNANEENKPIRIKTTKKTYAFGERVEFIGEVYDESFNIISDAEVDVKIQQGESIYNITLNPLGNGIYEGAFESSSAGDYSFIGKAVLNKKELGKDNGRFSVGETNIELMNPIADFEYLMLLSQLNNGSFYNHSDYSQIFNELEKISKNSLQEKMSVAEYNLWSDHRLLILLIFLLALEWFIRKREGMI
ncbi:MAG: VWA domain-containing protein [Ignavibacteria bacterium]|nr:VWA domain-containing protein [Ignavibacteria bacterium]